MSQGNAGEMAQGRGEDVPGRPVNDLHEDGIQQIRDLPPALAAAEIVITHVNSSEMLRAKQSATVFADAHPDPKPALAGHPVAGIKEVSQRGWEAVHTRQEVKELKKAALAEEKGRLLAAGLGLALEGHVAWTMPLGEGESPIAAALRGITALEDYGVKPGELIFSHAMLNRYVDAVATRIGSRERTELLQLLRNGSAVGRVAVIHILHELGMPAFKAADDKRNQQANGGITGYTIDHESGRWIAGRRIEPPKASDTHPYVEHRRGEDGLWTRITPGGILPAPNNE
jgi:broad specificity phosphatase PhoE